MSGQAVYEMARVTAEDDGPLVVRLRQHRARRTHDRLAVREDPLDVDAPGEDRRLDPEPGHNLRDAILA